MFLCNHLFFAAGYSTASSLITFLKMEWSKWNGKKIFLVLKSTNKNNKNIVYSGKVSDVNDNFISIIDKFGLSINIHIDEIKVIKEEA